MTWNYRLVRSTITWDNVDYTVYGIHEVYYDENGNIESWTENEVTMGSYETPEEVKQSMELIRKALTKPLLEEVTDENGKQKLITVPKSGENA